MKTRALSRIAFVVRSESRFFLLALAKQIRERFGSTLHLYCGSPQEVAFYEARNGDGLFASVNDSGVLLKSCRATGLDAEAVIRRARAFEERIGCTYNHLAISNRHLGRGYALGGFHHPRSHQSEKTGYVRMLHAYNEALSFWDREFADKGITLVVNGSKEAAVVARAHGIPYRSLAGARHKSYHYWAWNEYLENPAIEEIFRRGTPLPPVKMDAPYDTHRSNRARFMKSFGFGALARQLTVTVARHAYWKLRGYEAAKNYYATEMLRYRWRRWADYRRHQSIARMTVADLKGRPFVFFPLHIEPEAALQTLSPEYFYQLSAIAALSRDLPAGVLLAVKEHFGAFGRRPDNFYEQIAELKNVVLLNTWELGFDVIRQAEAVATICGSAGFEGAVMGKPVIAFGRHNTYNFLPHVRVVTDEAGLGAHLRYAVAGAHDPAAARADGERFLQAVVASSFDMRGYDYVNLHDFAPEAVDEACSGLAASIGAAAEDARVSEVLESWAGNAGN